MHLQKPNQTYVRHFYNGPIELWALSATARRHSTSRRPLRTAVAVKRGLLALAFRLGLREAETEARNSKKGLMSSGKMIDSLHVQMSSPAWPTIS
jgi:hypothetical protein